ncbi:MAG TPA: DUF1634 domain-containing protein [Candidatus Acidoferrales bacterium]|nr:DUF1634 domain-containing protein [Candidatus Acidoferrales bacterium]
MTETNKEETLEHTISYVLIAGVALSVIIEAIGMVSYYYTTHSWSIIYQHTVTLNATNFFSYAVFVIQSLFHGSLTPTLILGLGIVVLMITPYMRVLTSVIYFSLAGNPKYFFITLFVLVVLTASLLFH